jgi:hypothetical protein
MYDSYIINYESVECAIFYHAKFQGTPIFLITKNVCILVILG